MVMSEKDVGNRGDGTMPYELRHEIGKYLGGGKRKTIKVKKSKRRTKKIQKNQEKNQKIQETFKWKSKRHEFNSSISI